MNVQIPSHQLNLLYSARCCLLIEDKFLVASMEDETPLVYLIPTADGPGACTTALIKYLVFVHNKFIQNCRKIACQREADMAATARKETASIKKRTILTKSRGTTGKQQAGAKKSTPTKVSSESVQQRYGIGCHWQVFLLVEMMSRGRMASLLALRRY